MHIWYVLLMTGQRKDSLGDGFFFYGNSNFRDKEKVAEAEGSNSGSPIYGCGHQIGNLHPIILHNRA